MISCLKTKSEKDIQRKIQLGRRNFLGQMIGQKKRWRQLFDYHSKTGIDPTSHLESVLELKGEASYLDAGCGEAVCLSQIEEHFSTKLVKPKLTGIDILQKRQVKQNFEILPLDLQDLDEREMHDLVLSPLVIQYTPDPLKVVSNLYNSLTPGGILAFTSFGNHVIIDGVRLAHSSNNFYRMIKSSGGIVDLDIENHPLAVHITRGDPINFQTKKYTKNVVRFSDYCKVDYSSN